MRNICCHDSFFGLSSSPNADMNTFRIVSTSMAATTRLFVRFVRFVIRTVCKIITIKHRVYMCVWTKTTASSALSCSTRICDKNNNAIPMAMCSVSEEPINANMR
jgi:hypothetical protein